MSPASTMPCSWTARTGALHRRAAARPRGRVAQRPARAELTAPAPPPARRLTKTFSTLSFITVGDKYGQKPYKATRFAGKQFQTVFPKAGRTANTYFTSPRPARRAAPARERRAARARVFASYRSGRR